MTVRKDYDLLNKKESILAYIDDLHNLIKQNLDEVKTKVAQGGERTKLRSLIEDKLNVMNELKGSSKDDLQSIIELTNYLLENLRFADGRSLKDSLAERRLKRGLKEAGDQQDDEEEESSLLDEDEYGEEDEGVDEDEEDDEGQKQGDEDESADDGDSTSQLTDELEAEERERDRQVNEAALDALVNAEADVKKRKEQFAKNIAGASEAEQKELLKDLGGQLHDLNKEMELAQKKQDDRLKAALAAREKRRRAAQQKLTDQTQGLDQEVTRLSQAVDEQVEERNQLIDEGIGTDECQRELVKEKEEENNRLDVKKEEKVKEIRDEYMDRIKRARTAAEKERMLTEMQNRIKTVEAEQEKERKAQLKLLEKSLKSRQRRRLQKQLEEKDAEVAQLNELKDAKD